MTAASAARTGAHPAIPRTVWLALAVLLGGQFMGLLDTTIVNVALNAIRTGLHANEATLSWIISGYALAFGIVLIPAGRVGDRYGHKWTFIAGLSIFTLSSVACGVAQDSTALVVARVFQGLGGGVFFPAVAALIQLMFAPQHRGRAFAIMGATIGVSTALGPLVGGLLIQAFGETDGWRWIFFVNLPLGILVLIAAIALLPAHAEGKRLSTDVVGLALVTLALVALLVPLIEGQDQGWPAWTFASLAAGAVLLVAFWFWERRVERGPAEPLVPPHLFRHPSFTGGVVLALVYFAAFTSVFFTIALLWQAGLGHSALESGLLTIPFSLGSIVGASQSNRLAQRLGRTTLSIGTGCMAAGLLALWLIIELVPTANLTNWMLLAPLLAAGVGNGLFIAPNAQFIVATVDRPDAGAASAVIGTMQRVGSAIGIAVIGAVLFGNLPASFAPTKQEALQAAAVHGKDGLAAVRAALRAIVDQNLATGFGHAAAIALLVNAALAVIAFFLVFALPKHTPTHGSAPSVAPAAHA